MNRCPSPAPGVLDGAPPVSRGESYVSLSHFGTWRKDEKTLDAWLDAMKWLCGPGPAYHQMPAAQVAFERKFILGHIIRTCEALGVDSPFAGEN